MIRALLIHVALLVCGMGTTTNVAHAGGEPTEACYPFPEWLERITGEDPGIEREMTDLLWGQQREWCLERGVPAVSLMGITDVELLAFLDCKGDYCENPHFEVVPSPVPLPPMGPFLAILLAAFWITRLGYIWTRPLP